MRCLRCQSDNPSDSAFCSNCGTALQQACAQCDYEVPLNFAFCPQCGNPLPSPPAQADSTSEAELIFERLQRLLPKEFAQRLLATQGRVNRERRIVTILFSDVKGSTAMASDLDPEDFTEIMDGAFEVLIEPVSRYGGTLARLMGDAILAFFGAPVAHEDDAQRACLAALDITAKARRYAGELERKIGITDFDVRVGIHTGLVVVGEVGTDLRVEYTALGDAVNVAARIESAAEPGSVLISQATHRLVAPLFETTVLQPIQVKGKAEPVPVYQVLAAKTSAGKVRGVAGLQSPLVGREEDLAALRKALDRLQVGIGGIVTVVGEAGIGKSRLVAELHEQTLVEAQHAAPRWLEARCLSYGTSIAYLPWLDLLRGLLGVATEDDIATVRDALRQLVATLLPDHCDELFPYLARMMSLPLEAQETASLQDLEGGQVKAGTYQAAELLVESAAGELPLVLVLEDLHWADPTSLALLEQLLALTDRASLLLICIFRPRRDHGCWHIREMAARDFPHRHTDIWLQPLSPAEGTLLLSNLLRVEAIPAWFMEKILSAVEGNPFYMEEILRELIDQGVVVADRAVGRWQVAQMATTIRLPDTLQGALLARIDRLPRDSRHVLQIAAVIGRTFLHCVLAAIVTEEHRLDTHLVTLQREDMIRERARLPELEYIFKHELTRDAAYDSLLKSERRALHRQVAEALEGLFPRRVEEQLGLLAYHWERAGDAEKATEYLLRAGDQARLVYAHQEAVEYYQRALRFLKEEDDYERAARTLMKVGLTYHNAFEHQCSREAYDEGFSLWQKTGQVQLAAQLPPAPHALRIGIRTGEYPTLDPAMDSQLQSDAPAQLFSGLVAPTPEMEVVPDVAQRWEISDGGRTYAFHLRDDVHWSDGTPLTAHDFEYAWKRVLDPATGSPFASLLYDIKGARAYHSGQSGSDAVGVRAQDAVTLAIELEAPAGYFLHLLTHNATRPVPRHALEAHGVHWTAVDKIVTNGPFRAGNWQRNERLILVRNETYHGHFRGNVEAVELVFLGDLWGTPDWADRASALYESDVLDVVGFFGQGSERIRQKHVGEHLSFPALWLAYVGFDLSRPPFNDLRVRRAFALAIDRERFVHSVWNGLFTPTTSGLLPPGMPGHSPSIGLTFNPAQARQLLAEAGYSESHRFPCVRGVGGHPREVEHLQAQWRENLGLEVEWDVLDVTTAYDRLATDKPPLFWAAWSADYPDPDAILRMLFMHPFFRWHNTAYDELVQQARQLTDQEKRMELYRQADRILVEEVPLTPVMFLRQHLLVKPWVQNYAMSLMGEVFWKDVIIEPH